MGLGEMLRQLRLRSPRGQSGRELTVPEVEREYGLHRQTVYLWESKRSRPEPVDLRNYAAWLGASEAEILHLLDLRSRLPGIVEDDIPTLRDDTPTLEDEPTLPDAA